MMNKTPPRRHFLIVVAVVFLYLLNTAQSAHTEGQGPFKGYGAYYPQLKLLCQALHEDGRGEFLMTSAIAFSDRDPACGACRPLFQAISQSCKVFSPKKTPLPKQKPVEPVEGEAVETPTPLPTPIPIHNREPSALVIDRAVRLFGAIAEDPAVGVQTKQALTKLFFVLTDKTRSTVAERDYFDELQTFIFTVYETESAKKLEHAAEAASEPEPEKAKGAHLESLFDQ